MVADSRSLNVDCAQSRNDTYGTFVLVAFDFGVEYVKTALFLDPNGRDGRAARFNQIVQTNHAA